MENDDLGITSVFKAGDVVECIRESGYFGVKGEIYYVQGFCERRGVIIRENPRSNVHLSRVRFKRIDQSAYKKDNIQYYKTVV